MSGLRRHLPILVLLGCAAALFPLQSWTDAHASADVQEDEVLLFSKSENLKTMALGYESLLADVYWMRAIQYFGGKIFADPTITNRRGPGNFDLLFPLIDMTTTLDPHYLSPYRFGGFFVHDYVDAAQGRALLEKGIRNNPDEFRLYQDLAYLSWSDGDCETAANLYHEGGAKPGAPEWMEEMSGIVHANCGRADVAVEILRRQYEATDDPRVREDLAREIALYQAQVEVNFLRDAAEAYRQQLGSYPPSLAQMLKAMSSSQNHPPLQIGPGGAPVDPNGVPYLYDPATGAVTTNPSSMTLPALGPGGRAGGQ